MGGREGARGGSSQELDQWDGEQSRGADVIDFSIDGFTAGTATGGRRRRPGSRCPRPSATDSSPRDSSIQDRRHVGPVGEEIQEGEEEEEEPN